MSDPDPMGRVRPDGYELKWVLARPGDRFRGIVPFLVDDMTPREERIPSATSHDNHVLGVETLTIVVDDLPLARAWYTAILNDEGAHVDHGGAAGAGRRFTLGPHALEALAADGPAVLSNDRPVRHTFPLHEVSLRTASGTLVTLDSVTIGV
ncbi:MAG: VOC family protein [Vicinamibacterales bacterium]